ncbi:hypothetical protein PCE1_001805 [Barthelona sp. PCE]
MVLVYKGEDGCAFIRKLNPETGVFDNTRLYNEEYLGTYCFSKDEKILATVHLGRICVFDVETMIHLYDIETEGIVSYGCFSTKGDILTFRANDTYHSTKLSNLEVISNIKFTKGSNCWVNSEYIFIQNGSKYFKYAHTSKVSNIFEGDIMLQNSDGEAFVIQRCNFKGPKIRIRNADGTDTFFSEAHIVNPIKYCDISENFLVVANDSSFQVYNLETKDGFMYNSDLEQMQSICISPDQKHLFCTFPKIAYVFKIGCFRFDAIISKDFVGPGTVFERLADSLILLKNPIHSFFLIFNVHAVEYESNYIIHPVENGYLLFFDTKVLHINQLQKSEAKYMHLNGIIDVTNLTDSLFTVSFQDGTKMLLEWSADDGFGRIKIFEHFGILADDQTEDNDLWFRLAIHTEMFCILRDDLIQRSPDLNNQYNDLTTQVDGYADEIRVLEIPTERFFEWLSSDPPAEELDRNLQELGLVINYIHNMERIIAEFQINESLSSTFSTLFEGIESPVTRALNMHLYEAKFKELQYLDAYFDAYFSANAFFEGTSQASQVISTMTLVIDKHTSLTESAGQIAGLSEQFTEYREAMVQNEEPHPLDFDLLYSLRDQIERHRVDIVACETVLFENAKRNLLNIIEESIGKLNNLICEFSFAVELPATLEQLQLSSIMFPIMPKIINFDSYLNGCLEDFGLTNGILRQNDRFIKCICVSQRLSEESLNLNIKALRRELRVLTKLHPCVVSLKNVVFVPEMRRGEVSMKFVCIELERAPYDLEQYLNNFQYLAVSTRNDMAHQLVMSVFMMHATGIILRDLKPQNVLVFCNEDGSNPKLKLCDFGVSVSINQTMGGQTMGAGTFGYMAPEVLFGQPQTFLSDLFSLGKTVAYILAHDRTDITNLILPADCTHSEIIQRCQAQDPKLRPSIYELSCYEWRTIAPDQDRITLIRRQVNQFVVTKQALLRDNDREEGLKSFVQRNETFDEFFIRVFKDVNTFMSGADYFGASIKMHGMEQLSIPQFVEHIFDHRSLPFFDYEASDDLVQAMCGFLYCCFVLQVPVDDIQVGQKILNALSGDFDKLTEKSVFDRVFPTNSAYNLNMLKHEGLNFNFFGVEDQPVTSENMDAFLQLARKMVSEPWVELSGKVNVTFNAYELTAQLGVITFSEIKALMCGPPRFTAEQVLSTFTFRDDVPSDIRDTLKELLQGFNSLDMLQFVYWMNGSHELHSFTVIMQPVDTMLPSVALCDSTLRLPNNILSIRDGLPLAIRGILPNEFKLFITQKLQQWSQKNVDELNNSLRHAPLMTIRFNNISNVPSIRVCPKCLTIFEHIEGCKSMRCHTCTHEFCFSCLAPSAACSHFGQCQVAPVQQFTLEHVQERMKQFQ